MHELNHCYGAQVHVASSPALNTYLTDLGRFNWRYQPSLNQLVRLLYTQLLHWAVDDQFPLNTNFGSTTRMDTADSKAIWRGEIINRDQATIVLNIPRAGSVPAWHCYELISDLMAPSRVRMDEMYLQRATKAGPNDTRPVIGTTYSGSKIGGDITARIIVIPDPMGATGSTIRKVLDVYADRYDISGVKRWLLLHLVIAPEYIEAISKLNNPNIEIYTLRLDRGLSTERALAAMPGAFPREEKGLDENGYIIPGLGGVGEFLTNSYC